MPVLLVVDDEPSILHAFQRLFRGPEIVLRTAGTGAAAWAAAIADPPDAVILDVSLPDTSGLDLFKRLHDLDARLPVIFITGHATTDVAIEAVKMGAYDFLFKPLELDQLRHQVAKAFELRRLMLGASSPAISEAPSRNGDTMVGRCPAMTRVYMEIGRVAAQDVAVLIQGESGTGKELVARAIWQHSRRSEMPYLALNCAAIPEPLLESELFGHEKGAFTGADRQRIGKFEQCTRGTLFLDEVGDMTPLTQAKLLRVLQDQQFERLGGNQTIQTDVRVIAATNRDLKQMVGQGRFREDLYYRLSVFTIPLPPLRDRGDDLELLVQHFRMRFNAELGKNVQEIPLDTWGALRKHHWPGNVRELQSVLQQALLRTTGPVLLPDFLPPSIGVAGAAGPTGPRGPHDLPDLDRLISDRLEAGSEDIYLEAVALLDRHLLSRILEHTGGNQVDAARLLGLSRNTLRAKIRSLGIPLDKFERPTSAQSK